MNLLLLILFLIAAGCFFLDAINVPHVKWIAVGLCVMAVAFAIMAGNVKISG